AVGNLRDFTDVLSYYQGFYFDADYGTDGTDSLAVDISSTFGAPIPSGTTPLGGAVQGILYEAGGSAGDTLTLNGNNTAPANTSVTYSPSTTLGSGGANLSYSNGTTTTAGNISFTGVDTFTANTLSALALSTPAAADVITIDTPSAGRYRV